MKKHIIAILIIICILSTVGICIWIAARRNNEKNLYEITTAFIENGDTTNLKTCITNSQSLYQSKGSSSDTTMTTLCASLTKMDTIQNDLNTYLVFQKSKNSSRSLTKKYKDLQANRTLLLEEYEKYIIRMKGNTEADGNSIHNLYNEMIDKTVSYLYKYTNCLDLMNDFIFDNVYKSNSIKRPVYDLYIAVVNSSLNGMSNYRFSSTFALNKLNNRLNLDNGSVKLKNDLTGGEFSAEAMAFKVHCSGSNLSTLATHFEDYYNLNIDETETSNEKLTIFYLKKIMEV